jgi:DNA-binding LacI/PurR family transcriptional regulator
VVGDLNCTILLVNNIMVKLTQTRIAKELGISQSTISLVMANPLTKRVSTETRDRIFDYIDNIDPSFRPKRHTVGDICYLAHTSNNITGHFYTRLLDGAEAEAKEQGVNLIFKRWQKQSDFESLFADSNISGIIHTGAASEEDLLLLQRFAPTVLLNYTFDNFICNMVTIDNHGGIRQAVTHFYEKGHRNIAYLTYNLQKWSGHFIERLGGYYEGMYSLGLPIREGYVDGISNNYHKTVEAEDVVDRFMALEVPPTAVVCGNDAIAIALLKAASSRGLNLPEQMSVIGFDNSEVGQQWRPELTSIHQKREDMGRAAVALLTRKIKEGRSDIPEKVLCEAELIIRQSVADIR